MLSICCANSYANADVVLIGNNEGAIANELNRQQVRNMFMGRNTPENLKVVALESNHPVRVIFNTKVIGLTEARIQSYWAQMKFSGRKKPPLTFTSEIELIEFIQQNPNALGYVSAGLQLPDGIKVIYSTAN